MSKTFLHIDCISGSLYNNTNTPNLHLPKDSHKTTFSSKTLGLNEKGINEISLENIKDNELISIHAQKDYDELIEHNFSQTIKNNKESTIKGHYNESITKTHTQDIALAKIIKVGAEYNTNVALSKNTIVGTSNTLSVGANNKLKVEHNSSEF
ncbi:bacteriophage T4 gp5 trimerisation domain-containing protein, partial [Helicobacter sp. T3_23-1056]